MIIKYINKDNYNTVNDVLINEFQFSSRLMSKLIKNKKIYLNNSFCDTRKSINYNDEIVVDLSGKENNSNIVATNMDLDIIYEDDWFLVVNKQPGIAVHPSSLHYSDSLSNGVKFYFDKIGLKKKIRVVNRLDYNTSGIVVFAKCEYIHEQFSKQMMQHIFQKEYLCIINGFLDNSYGIIDLPIDRKQGSIIERCIDKNGQKSITHYEVLKTFSDYSLVKCILETGRTHQIRVHFSAIGHPLLGDTLYGTASDLINRQALHSNKIDLIHPITKEHLSFESLLPNDMNNNPRVKPVDFHIGL